jgi:L-alanine-DL-glutamate epimerase-like enolase superfamily enzyme
MTNLPGSLRGPGFFTKTPAMRRRSFFKTAALGALIAPSIKSFAHATRQKHDPSLREKAIAARITNAISNPLPIHKIELLKAQGELFVVVHAAEFSGIAVCNQRMQNLDSLLKGLIIPYYLQKDARQITTWCEGVFLDERNYKYGGMPFWNCAGSVEIAIWDLLGKAARKPVHFFLGEQVRQEIPVYLSSLTRNTTAQQESDFLGKKMAETGAKAVKIKVGGRMQNTPQDEARTQALTPLLRKTFGDQLTIYADANGSYTPEEGIRVGKFLESHGVAIFEEACSWEDYAGNLKVNKSLKSMKLAGGEQDSSTYRFQDIAEKGIYDVLQPDVYYNGGILRTLKVADLAAQHGRYFAPHSPKADPLHAPFSQLMAVAPAVFGFQEYPSSFPAKQPSWYGPHIIVEDGKLPILTGPGLGMQYDEALFKSAEKIV